jgi:TPR repeat protein
MKRTNSTSRVMPSGEKQGARELLEEACELFEAGDRSRSIKLFLKAATKGSREAQVNIGNIYDDGDGVVPNFDKARYWYKRAVTSGSPEGAYNLGIGYLNRGDTRWSAHWFRVAKSMGHKDANEKLSKLRK